jgi:glutamine amidotransferase
MCRIFALQANQPTRVESSLQSAPHSLRNQSGCDRRGVCHESGWGIAYYTPEGPRLVRSARSARQDPRYGELAGSVASGTILAHVRLASSGSVAERNSHPFVHGRWSFAHNGTLFGFGANPDRLRNLIPVPLRQCIGGDTDSEHAFYFILGLLEQRLGSLDRPAEAAAVGEVFAAAVGTLLDLFPGEGDERSQFNGVLTDGRVLVASRRRHSLWWVERHGKGTSAGDGPVGEAAGYRAVAVASEPTTAENWSEVPEGSVLHIDPEFRAGVRTF